MMKPWIKILIGAVIGFGAGFGSGFFCHKKLNDARFEEITEDEMDKIIYTAKEKSEEIREELDRLKNRIENVKPSDENGLRNAMQGKVSYIRADQEAKAKYASVWGAIKDYSDTDNADKMPVEETEEEEAPFDPEEGFDGEFLESLELEEVEPGQMESPHPITMSQFYNERPEYDKVTIDFFEPDKEYRDENEEVIADIESYVGSYVGKIFDTHVEENEDPDVRFFRNTGYSSDYEIIRHKISYMEMTEGGS